MKNITKYLTFLFCICLLSCANNSSDGSGGGTDRMTTRATELAEKAGPYIINCCSGFAIGGKTEYVRHRVMKNDRLSIKLCVNWTSEATTCNFRVCGELNINQDGCNPEWIHESADKKILCILQPGCRHVCTAKFSNCL